MRRWDEKDGRREKGKMKKEKVERKVRGRKKKERVESRQ